MKIQQEYEELWHLCNTLLCNKKCGEYIDCFECEHANSNLDIKFYSNFNTNDGVGICVQNPIFIPTKDEEKLYLILKYPKLYNLLMKYKKKG